MSVAPAPRTPSQVLGQMRAVILADFEPELVLACKVAVLMAGGLRPVEIKRYLDVSDFKFKAAKERVDRVAERLDPGD